MTTDPFKRGLIDCVQDDCENIPFVSTGGLNRRKTPSVPYYIAQDEEQLYLDGYLSTARQLYGEDWATCELGTKK